MVDVEIYSSHQASSSRAIRNLDVESGSLVEVEVDTYKAQANEFGGDLVKEAESFLEMKRGVPHARALSVWFAPWQQGQYAAM